MNDRPHQSPRPPEDPAMDRLLRDFAEASTSRARAQGDGSALRERIRTQLREGRPALPRAVAAAEVIPSPGASRRSLWRDKKALAIAAVLLIAAAGALAVYTLVSTTDAGRMIHQRGNVEVARLDGSVRITTSADSGAVYAPDGERVMLFVGEDTVLVVEAPDRIHLEQGGIWAAIEPESGPFSAITPEATVDVVGTVYGVTTDDGESQVAVARGRVRVTSAGGSIDLAAGQETVVSGGKAPGEPREVGGEPVPEWAWELLAEARGIDFTRYYPSAHHK